MSAPRPPGTGVVRALSCVVPASHREDWTAEWLAELAYAWRESGPSDAAAWRLRLRSLGALVDALWLRRHHGRLTLGRPAMLVHDLRFAARSLSRRPASTAIVVATLALCIGASTAVFSIVESVLLRGLTYADRNTLVAVWSDNQKEQNDHYPVSVGDYYDLRARSRSFAALAGFFPIWNATYTAPDAAERLEIGAVSANFLRTLGVRPALGRDFVDGEDQPGAQRVAILSDGFRTRFFHDDLNVLGKTVTLDNQTYVVAGVMPPGFTFPQNKVDVIVPLPILGSYLQRREVHMLSVIGRLNAGVSPERARQELSPIVRGLEQEHPTDDAGLGVTVRPLTDDLLGDVRRPILILFGAVCAVLLIGCANVANLMLARAAGRRQELAVRAAMGAPAGAIARQLLTETALIAVLAGVAGVLIAVGATRGIASLLPVSIGRIGQPEVNAQVLIFTLVVCAAVTLLCGIAPALRGARASSGNARSLTDSARGASSGRGVRRFHRTLVVVELALASVLAAAAALLIGSFTRLTTVDPGFRTDHVVRMKLALPGLTYPRGLRRDAFFQSLMRETAALPGVRSVGFVSRFPLHEGNITTATVVEGAPPPRDNQAPSADYRVVGGDYFQAMGIPLLTGRQFGSGDTADSTSAPVVIVNRTAALSLFQTANAVGRRVKLGTGNSPFMTVVGVVGDVHDESLRAAPRAQVFVSSRQTLASAGSIVVHYSTTSPASIVGDVRRIVRSLDSSLPVFDVQTIEEVMDGASVGDRFTTTLLTSFASLALLLAVLGIYGVIAYGVAERTREIGIRMALGARAGEVLAMVIGEGVSLFVISLPFALIGIWWAMRSLSSLLYQTGATNPATIGVAVATIASAATIACIIPARRASRIDPVTAIREV